MAHPDMGAVWVFNHRGKPQYRINSPKSEVVTNVAYGEAGRLRGRAWPPFPQTGVPLTSPGGMPPLWLVGCIT